MSRRLLLSCLLAASFSSLGRASVIYTLVGTQYFDHATFEYIAPDYVTSSITLSPSQLVYCTFDSAACKSVRLGVSAGGDSITVADPYGDSDGISGLSTTLFNTLGTYNDEIISFSVEPGPTAPEPATFLLSALPLIAIAALRRRKTTIPVTTSLLKTPRVASDASASFNAASSRFLETLSL